MKKGKIILPVLVLLLLAFFSYKKEQKSIEKEAIEKEAIEKIKEAEKDSTKKQLKKIKF